MLLPSSVVYIIISVYSYLKLYICIYLHYTVYIFYIIVQCTYVTCFFLFLLLTFHSCNCHFLYLFLTILITFLISAKKLSNIEYILLLFYHSKSVILSLTLCLSISLSPHLPPCFFPRSLSFTRNSCFPELRIFQPSGNQKTPRPVRTDELRISSTLSIHTLCTVVVGKTM